MTYEDVRPPFRINTRISADTNDWLDKKAYELGVTKSALISMAIEDYRKNTEAVYMIPGMMKAMDDQARNEGKKESV